MKMQSPYLWFTFIFLMVSFKAQNMRCQNPVCNSNDLRALISFSNCIESVTVGWNISTSNCCTWTGVTCDNSTISSKRVVKLELGSKRLTGKICEPSLEDLDQLRILNLSQNILGGYLPAKLFHLRNLEVLDLSQNEFFGPILEGTDLPSIRYVDISMNSFNGFVDTTLCETSPHIQVLNLSKNYFTGEVSARFGRCTSLQHLLLNGNHLSGNFPQSLLQLQNLRTLHLQDNLFSGPLNSGIGNLSNLVEFDISSNMFSGFLPDVFEKLGKLEYFCASSNKFNGRLPKSLVNSPSLLTLDLDNNTLYGSVNLNCSAMIHLTSLNLGSNSFHGPVPNSIFSCQRLTMLNLARNNISSEVPLAFKNLQALKFLSLANTSLVNISSALAILQNCKNLTSLILSFNFRDEQMPSGMNFDFRNLKTLAIPRCDLRGSFPIWLSNSNMLQVLDLSWNRLSGTIPFWFHDFKYLFYMDLSNNSFNGEIPKSLTDLQALINMNISLERHSLGCPLFKSGTNGAIFKYNGIWSLPPTLDLSCNKLTGPIWPDFGNLKRLHALNLKENHLSGSIPDSLSGMTNLEVLDFSHNELSGEIPRSLEKLSFLSKFSVAYNQLHGEIPTGGQFMTFELSSFEGNKDLCCGDLTPCQPQQVPQVQSDKEEMAIIGLQFGLGATIGFLLTVAFSFKSV